MSCHTARYNLKRAMLCVMWLGPDERPVKKLLLVDCHEANLLSLKIKYDKMCNLVVNF